MYTLNSQINLPFGEDEQESASWMHQQSLDNKRRQEENEHRDNQMRIYRLWEAQQPVRRHFRNLMNDISPTI